MIAILGLALLAIAVVVFRRLRPQSDGLTHRLLHHAGAEATAALVITASLALGIGLLIAGGIEVWTALAGPALPGS